MSVPRFYKVSQNFTETLVPNPRAAILGGMQPSVAKEFHNDRADGAVDRFFFVTAKSRPRRFDVPPVSSDLEQEWHDRIMAVVPSVETNDLLPAAMQFAADDLGIPGGDDMPVAPLATPDEDNEDASNGNITVFKLTPEATKVFGDWYENNNPAEAPPYMRGFAAKLDGQCLRPPQVRP